MTLLISVLSENDAYLFSDRQVTDFSTGEANSEVEKTVYVEARDSRFITGFCGLAFAGTGNAAFRAEKFVIDALYEVGSSGVSTTLILDLLAEKATQRFVEHAIVRSLSKAQRRLQVVVVGFRHSIGPFRAVISNSYDPNTGAFTSEAADSFVAIEMDIGGSEVRFHGHVGAVDALDGTEILELLDPAVPRDALIGKAVHTIREVSDRPKSSGAIGKDIQLARMAYPDGGLISSFYPLGSSELVRGIAQVNVSKPGHSMAIRGMEFSSPGSIHIDPTFPPRKPCPCGSKKRFKNCHGRISRRSI